MSANKAVPPAVEVTSHSNVVTLTDLSGIISSITYLDNSLVISEGQPASPPPSITMAQGVFKITLEAGRHKTTPVADSFNNLSGGRNNEYAPSGDSGTPSQLNFFFGVVIEIVLPSSGSSGSVTVYLGQGSFGTTNNWWIGGSCISNFDQPLLVVTAGGEIANILMSGTEDSFSLVPLSVRPVSAITNVFVLMLENHSFDNIFAASDIPNIIAATTNDSNEYNGVFYNVDAEAPPAMPSDPGHEFTDVVTQLAGMGQTYPSGGPYPPINLSGFVANYATTTTEGPPPPAGDIGEIMACFETPSDLPVIYQLATEFAICDQWFSSLPGPTWPNRFFVHGASSSGLDHSPSKAEMIEWETLSGFTYPHGSIYDALRAAGISYGLFIDTDGPTAGGIPQVAAIRNIKYTDVDSLTDFVSDLQGEYAYQYTFIEPNYGDITSGSYEGGSSQHPMDSVAGGEQLIQTVYEAIRNSSIWGGSLLFIIYDEHGGFYDHVVPPPVTAPNDDSSNEYNQYGFNFEQLGVRVPAVIVSPWIASGTVDHTIYDHSSVLQTIEELFGLSPLTDRDGNANSLLHLISDTFRTDCPTMLPRPALVPTRPEMTVAHRMVLDRQPLPERGNLPSFLGIMLKTELELSGGTPAERAVIIARFETIKTRGDARAYIESVIARATASRSRRDRR